MTFFYYILLLNVTLIFCGEIKNQIYYEFPEHSISHCVRRLNKSSAIGCTSKSTGNVGLVEVAFNQSHLFDKLSQLSRHTILVLSSNLFIQPNVTNLLLTNKFVQGLLVVENDFCNETFCNEIQYSFSEDYKQPNSGYSLSINHTFNPAGTEFGFKSWPFPIAYLNERYQSEQNKLLSCYNKFNKHPTSSKRCALEIKNFMAAVKSGDTCLKYQNIQDRFAGMFNNFQYCTDFTGKNYYIYTKETVKSRDSDSVIVLTARMDSLSMFERSAVSSNGAITSSAVLLAVMKLLTSQPQFESGDNLVKDVLFLFLDNESYDYLGSNRFFYDLRFNNIAKSTSVAINETQLALLLEFGELAYANFSQLNFFYPNSFLPEKEKNETLTYLNELKKQFQTFGFHIDSDVTKYNLPPSSSQFFMRQRIMPSIVMADHRSTFHNPFYNSFLDKIPQKNNSNELLAIVNAVASFVFKEATGQTLTSTISHSDPYTPDKIIECFANNLLCDLMQEILPFATLQKLNTLGTPIPTQAHSSSKDIPSDYRFSYLLENLVVYLSGRQLNNSVCDSCPSCSNLTSFVSGNGTQRCFKTRINVYDEFSLMTSPMWLTSSIVDRQSVRMFVLGSNPSLLITGCIITVGSLFIMLLLSSKMSVVFSPSHRDTVI